MDSIVRKRGVIRASVTRLLNQVKDLDPAKMSALQLRTFMLRVEDLGSSLKELDAQVEAQLAPEDNQEAEFSSIQEYRETLCEIQAILLVAEELISSSKTSITEASTPTTQLDSNPSTTLSVNATQQNIRLPKLQLRKFSGTPSEWKAFWDQFEVTIHRNASITTIDKFCYLKGQLCGTAAAAIDGLPLTEANYQISISILQERFGKSDLAVNEHLNHLMNLRPVSDTRDVKALRQLYDQFSLRVRALIGLGVPVERFATTTLPLIQRCVPQELLLQFSREKLNSSTIHPDQDCVTDVTSGSSKEFEELMLRFKQEIETREKCQLIRQTTLPFTKKRDQPVSNREGKSCVQSSVATLRTLVKDDCPKTKCIFCSKDHESASCSESATREERTDLIKRQGRCFRCLRIGHRSKDCKDRSIKCNVCQKRHPTVLHRDLPSAPVNQLVSQVQVNTMREKGSTILLQTATVHAEGPQNCVMTRILFDTGSHRTFVSTELSKRLHLPVVGKEIISVSTFACIKPQVVEVSRVLLKLISQWDSKISCSVEALEMNNVTCSLPSQAQQSGIPLKLQLADHFIDGKSDVPVEVIIGADNYCQFMTGATKEVTPGLLAIETKFGWTLMGTNSPSSSLQPQSVITSMKVFVQPCRSPDIDLQAFWELEHLGITDPSGKQPDKQLQNFHDEYTAKIQMVGGHYRAPLPWLTSDVKAALPDNKGVALRRLSRLVTSLAENPIKFQEYHKAIMQYVEQGHAEEVTNRIGPVIYYMPHRGVYKENRTTTRLRIVFDASSHKNGSPSLNECLESGPNLNPDLAALLIRFRLKPICLTADIEAAFLQVELEPSDRDAVRFLWLAQPKIGEMADVKEYRMTRLPFGLTSSPYILAATIKQHLQQHEESSLAVKALNADLYVDDLVTGVNTVEEGQSLYHDACGIMKHAGMNLRKWTSNHPELQALFDKEENSNSTEVPNLFGVLGLKWCRNSDQFSFTIQPVLDCVKSQSVTTKRAVLKTTSKIFDPLGFLSPITVQVKAFFQELWKHAYKWDEQLPLEHSKIYHAWIAELPDLMKLHIPRLCTTQDTVMAMELHVFCDASPVAYCAAAYLRTVTEKDDVNCHLIMAKNRVAPLKDITLPRLELMGGLLAARLAHYLKPLLSVQPQQIFLWTDSTIALHWIRGDVKRWKQFVGNRVKEIQELTAGSLWNYCAGTTNPADLATRGLSVKQLKDSSVWWTGPKWLRGQDPQQNPFDEQLSERDSNACAKEAKSVPTVVMQTTLNTKPLIDLQLFSSWRHVTRIIGYVLRFAKNTRAHLRNQQFLSGCLSAEEILRSESFLVKQVQEEFFADEIDCLQRRIPVPKQSILRNFAVFLDDQKILRLGGRLSKGRNLTNDEIHPVIIPSSSKLTELLIHHVHQRIFHGGVSHTLSEIRQHYWIPRARQIIKQLLQKCVICKAIQGKAGSQVTAPLPEDRITSAAPFQVVGIDFAGPLYVKVGRSLKKMYICLFTCAVTRAIHLELVTGLTTQVFILALRRFVARRGLCRVIYSDNAKTFIRANKELKEIWSNISNRKTHAHLANLHITWKFITPRAAWWGGFWERMVRTVKNCLKKVLGRSMLNTEELTTVLTEVESVVNSRPITYVSNDPSESLPLCPAHFLIGHPSTTLPTGDLNPPASTSRRLLRLYEHRELLVQQFWKRWSREYLLQLRTAHQCSNVKVKDLQIGDIVLMQEKYTPRQQWPRGLLVECHHGRDGLIRSWSVRLPTGSIIRRPVQLLYPLEVHLDVSPCVSSTDSSV